jgi:hypothetical protein
MSVSAKVELYVSKRPYLKQALSEGVINYSALGRKICDEKGIESLEAVKAALSRYEDFISEKRQKRISKVEEVVSETNVQIFDGVKVEKDEEYEPASIVSAKTENGFTNVLENGEKTLVTLVSPENLESTPGVLEFILSSLAAEGINIDHLISCREDTHLIVDKDQASDVLELLQERMS